MLAVLTVSEPSEL